MDSLSNYNPKDDREAQSICERITPRSVIFCKYQRPKLYWMKTEKYSAKEVFTGWHTPMQR